MQDDGRYFYFLLGVVVLIAVIVYKLQG